jgi:class 3 adenylate cyclase
MKLVVTAFMTLDGIIEAPGFDEHRTGRNAWALRVQTEEDLVYNKAQVMSADALLLGRRTWQIGAAFWPTASESGVGGIAVHIAARVLGSAVPGRIVVTKTVRDLVTGTDLRFTPLSEATLRGVPGRWDLFEARTADR